MPIITFSSPQCTIDSPVDVPSAPKVSFISELANVEAEDEVKEKVFKNITYTMLIDIFESNRNIMQ